MYTGTISTCMGSVSMGWYCTDSRYEQAEAEPDPAAGGLLGDLSERVLIRAAHGDLTDLQSCSAGNLRPTHRQLDADLGPPVG